MLQAEFVFEQAPFRSCHASTIVEAAPGKFLAAWFGGLREGARDVAIWLSRYDGSWSEPERAAVEFAQPCWNPVLFREADGEVTLFYKAGPNPDMWSGFYRRSSDGGQTFGDAYILPAGLLGPIKNKPIQLPSGVILAPTSVESYRAWGCWVERSTDRGRTWNRQGPISHPEQPYGVIQPTLLVRGDGSILALMRSRNIGQVCSSVSTDEGLTWSHAQAVAELPNPNSGIDAVTLRDGRHVLIYNPTHDERTPLVVGLSDDDGQTWRVAETLESEPGEFSYPAVIQDAAGLVHVTYTWQRERVKHVVLDPAEWT